jgi:hypothetical protein
LTEENRSTQGKTCPSATLSTTNPTWTEPGSNPGLHGERPATNRLSHGTALVCRFHLLLKPLLTVRGISLHLLPLKCQKPYSVPRILRNVTKHSRNYFSFKINRLHIVILKIQKRQLQILTPNVNSSLTALEKSELNFKH